MAAPGVLISLSTGSWLQSCRSTDLCVGCEAVGSSFVVSKRAKVFHGRLPHGGAGRSRRGSGGGRTVLARAERQSDEEGGARDGFDNVDISVFRFTLGIPGFDDSDLPRVVGILLGGLIILNHAFSLNAVTPALLRSEAVGLFLAAVSISLPAINRQLNGGKSGQRPKPGQKQVFALADSLSETQRQEVAWSTYTLLRNTESTACLIWYGGKVVCARGFWEVPSLDGLDAKSSSLVWLEEKLKAKRFAQLEEPLHLPSNADSKHSDVVPRGTASLLLQPFPHSSISEGGSVSHGFVLAISSTPQAYRRKDRIWIAAIAKKLSGVLPQ